MEVKKKPINRNDWKRVYKKKIAFCEIKEKEGMACLIQAQEITSPLVKNCFGKDVTLVDVGYYWLQLAFKNENVWLTVMFDEKGNFVQYYFDVTRRNVIDGENSYFEDLFLDVIVQENDEIDVLDLNELKLALDEKVISNSEFELANKIKDEIIENLFKNRDKCDRICVQYFNILRKMLGE